jgi:hypothetical protein
MNDRLANLRRNFWKEKWLLLLCFVLAFVAWHTIRRNISLPLPVSNIPIEIEAPEGWAVLDKSLDTVDIRFMGSREDIRDLNSGTLRVVIPVTKPVRGKMMRFTLHSKYIRNNPSDAKVDRFNPEIIELMLDQETERALPVKATLDGMPPEGLEVESIVCKPVTVLVKGAQQQIGKMENIHTESIDMKNRQESFKENVRIALPQGGRLEANPDRVSVQITLEARSSTVVMEKVPVRVLSSPGDRRRINVQPLSISVTIRGQQQRIDQLRAGGLFAYVSCMELDENTGYDLPVTVDLPAGLKLIKTEPAAVRVEIGTVN